MEFFVLFVFFVTGLIFGSFANVLVDRGEKGESLLGFSHCDHCKKQLKWFDNIPVVSFLFLGGKSRCCGKKLSWQYPLVEFFMGILFVVFGRHSIGLGEEVGTEIVIRATFYLFIVFIFFVILVWDLKYMIIPDELVVTGVGAVFFYYLYLYLSNSSLVISYGNDNIISGVIGGLIIGGFFYLLFTLSKGKWIGGGDVKLGMLIGLLVGWKMTYFLLLFAYVLGAVLAVFLLSFGKKKWKSKIPFGPFLILATWIVLLFGNQIMDFWKRLALEGGLV